jgi:hypothetical protein
MNCIWAEYNEHLDDTATVASMVGCWVNPSSLYDELVVVLVRLVSWLGNPSAMLRMYIIVASKNGTACFKAHYARIFSVS